MSNRTTFKKIGVLSIVLLALVVLMPLAFPVSALAQDGTPPVDPLIVEVGNPEGADLGGFADLLTSADMKRGGIVLFLVFGNWLSASLVALAQRTFDLKKFPEFFYGTFLPFFGGFLLFEAGLHILTPSVLLEAFGKDVSPQFSNVFDASFLWAVFGSILLSVGRSFVGNMAALLGLAVKGAQKLAATATPSPVNTTKTE